MKRLIFLNSANTDENTDALLDALPEKDLFFLANTEAWWKVKKNVVTPALCEIRGAEETH